MRKILLMTTTLALLAPVAAIADAGEGEKPCMWCKGVVTSGDFRFGIHEDYASVGVAAFDVLDNTDGADEDSTYAQGKIDWRGKSLLYGVGPIAGVDVDVEGGVFTFAGLNLPIFYNESIVINPHVAVGHWHEDDSADLGGPVEFRSSIELGYKLPSCNSIVAVGFNHYSNASIYDENPGTETAYISLSIPLGGSIY